MEKIPSFYYGYAACFLASILLNMFLVTTIFHGGISRWKWNQLNWSKSAAEEAETVASIDCSGHGRAFLDGLVVYGSKPVCECYSCFQGSDCSRFLADNCVADANSGDPLYLEPFWMQHASSSAVVVSGWHRMSYSFNDHQSIMSQELETHIRMVHGIAKNAITDGRYIVCGAGSTQVILAAIYALSSGNSSFPIPARVAVSTPYYSFYKTQIEYFKTDRFEFGGDTTSMLKNSSSGGGALNVIEIVTSPNNPDGKLKKAILNGSSVSTIYDHAYYWPYYTAIHAPADEDLMLFTLSKLTGHAGSRFGWAIVKDKGVYERMKTYIEVSELGLSKDTELRALKLLKVITNDHGKGIFDFGHKTMRDRWVKISQIISHSTRFSLQDLSSEYCSFFKNVRGPSPAYAWLKCEREEDKDCEAVLEAAKIIGREGRKFNAEGRYVRLSLLKSRDDFEWLLHRLNELVMEEAAGDGAEAM